MLHRVKSPNTGWLLNTGEAKPELKFNRSSVNFSPRMWYRYKALLFSYISVEKPTTKLFAWRFYAKNSTR